VCVILCKPKGGGLVALNNVPLFLVCPVRLNGLHILALISLDVCIKSQLTWQHSHMTGASVFEGVHLFVAFYHFSRTTNALEINNNNKTMLTVDCSYYHY